MNKKKVLAAKKIKNYGKEVLCCKKTKKEERKNKRAKKRKIREVARLLVDVASS